MKIQPIVEGHGEVAAVPILLRRLCEESGCWQLQIGAPVRRKRFELVTEDALRKAVRLALLQPECAAILILFDADDDCPKELAPQLQQWASDEAGAVPCAVILANREYEAWFLAALESLRGKRGIRADAAFLSDAEVPRGAKEKLEDYMERGHSYSETADQAALTAAFDFAVAYLRSRSFRKMVSAFGTLVERTGVTIEDWPPARWLRSG